MAKNNTVKIVAIIALVFIVYFLTSAETSEGNTISATGNSEIKVDPDLVTLYLTIETRNSSAEIAKDENSEITQNVLTSLENIQVPNDEIQTLNYNIYPEYDWSKDRQEMIGYIATNTILIENEDFDNIGKIIDAAVDNGALVNSINFALSNDKLNEYKAQALEKASQDSKTKAQAIASGLDKKLGKLVSVSTSDYDYMPYPLYERADTVSSDEGFAQAKEAAVNINPTELEVRATVSATYKIA